MPKNIATSLSSLIAAEAANTHHIRLKCARELFHDILGKYGHETAANITCEMLKISRSGLDYALSKDITARQKKHDRDLLILKYRVEGYSPKAIQEMTGLSRVQVWRVIRALEDDLLTVKTLQKRKIRARRLKYHEMPSGCFVSHCQ